MTDMATAAQTDRARGGTALEGEGRRMVWLNSDRLAIGLAAVVAITAAGVLAGWALRWPILASWLPGGVQMKVNAALCFVSLSLALVLRAGPRRRSRGTDLFAAGLALVVIAVSGATLYEHFSGVSLGIDQALVIDTASADSPHPGRMAVQTVFAFLAAALAFLALDRSSRGVYLTEVLGLICGLVGGVSLLGYMYGATALLSVGSAQQIALPAAFALTLLGLALLVVNPAHRLVRLIGDPGSAGQVMRVFLPAALLVVPAGAWLRLMGERAGLYDTVVGLTIMVAFEAIVLAAIGFWTTSRVQRLEEQRAEARRDRDRFFELTSDLVCVVDNEGRLVLASPSWEQTLGFPLAEISSRQFIDFVHPDDREATLAEFGSELTGHPAYSFQNRYVCADGTFRWLEWNAKPDPASNRVYAVARDVTERMRADASLARLAAIVESSNEGILAVDPAGCIFEWNAGAEALFGYTADEAIGRPLSLTAPEGEQAEQQRRWSEAAAGRPQTYETFRSRKDGSRFRARVTLFPIDDRNGVQLGVSTIVHDVTDAYEARRRLENNSRELARSNAELEQFAYVASHDLQEPLRMVTGFMGLLEKKHGNKLGQEAEEYIGFAVDGARRMQALIDGLLTYSRVGSRGTAPVSLAMGEAVDTALRNLKTLIDETGATIGRDDLPAVTADRQQVVQLYQNLIGNAIKFRGEKPAQIELGAERGEGEWRFFVRDHGIGIPPEHRDNVFVIFRRLNSREDYPGSGIGLAICKRIVDRHGGQVWVESTPGGGSTFWFTLPDHARSEEDG
jgi:PAS domain S-box-containing protein